MRQPLTQHMAVTEDEGGFEMGCVGGKVWG